jgi:hypothetical protein
MILALFLLLAVILFNSFSSAVSQQNLKKIGIAVSVTLVGVSFFAFSQNYTIPYFINHEELNLLRMIFSLLLVGSLFLDNSTKVLFQKVILLFLLFSNSLEFQATFLLGSIALGEYLEKGKFNGFRFSVLLALILFSLNFSNGIYSSSFIVLLFSLLILLKHKDFSEIETKNNSFFFVITLSVFIEHGLIPMALAPLLLVSIIYLFNMSKVFLRRRSEIFYGLLSLSIIFLSMVSILGLNQLFYFVLSFLFLASILAPRGDYRGLHWKIFFFLFTFSPPFGLGFMTKVEVLEKSMAQPWYVLMLVGVFIALTQLLIFLVALESKATLIDSFKKISFSTNITASAFLGISLLLSLLFLPENWIQGYGSLFFKKLSSGPSASSRGLGIGYSIFWIELLFWAICFGIYFKTSPDFFKKSYFSFILLGQGGRPDRDNQSPLLGKPHQEFVFSSKKIITSLDLAINKIPPQYFTLMMLIILGSMLAGLV